MPFHDRAATWGEQGYIYLSRTDNCQNKKGECGLQSQASYPTAGSALPSYDELPNVQ